MQCVLVYFWLLILNFEPIQTELNQVKLVFEKEEIKDYESLDEMTGL